MAEWWDKKYEFKLWSSLWLFLKEVEGLDDARARLYLEQLLESRYDTVDVLKLATKEDLVEDADVLPADALRVIAAAKVLVARRDADCAELSQQQRYYGGEVRGEFPVMQEANGAGLKTGEHGRGFLPLPRHKMDQQGLCRGIPTRNGRIYYACGLCQVTCCSEHSLRQHFSGKKHASRMEQGEEDGRRTAVRYAGTSASGELVICPRAFHCSLCNITCTCKNDLITHFKGRRHQAAMEESSGSEEPEHAFEYALSERAALCKPVGPSRPADFLQPVGQYSQAWQFQVQSATRGLANLSMR